MTKRISKKQKAEFRFRTVVDLQDFARDGEWAKCSKNGAYFEFLDAIDEGVAENDRIIPLEFLFGGRPKIKLDGWISEKTEVGSVIFERVPPVEDFFDEYDEDDKLTASAEFVIYSRQEPWTIINKLFEKCVEDSPYIRIYAETRPNIPEKDLPDYIGMNILQGPDTNIVQSYYKDELKYIDKCAGMTFDGWLKHCGYESNGLDNTASEWRKIQDRFEWSWTSTRKRYIEHTCHKMNNVIKIVEGSEIAHAYFDKWAKIMQKSLTRKDPNEGVEFLVGSRPPSSDDWMGWYHKHTGTVLMEYVHSLACVESLHITSSRDPVVPLFRNLCHVLRGIDPHVKVVMHTYVEGNDVGSAHYYNGRKKSFGAQSPIRFAKVTIPHYSKKLYDALQ